MKSINWIGNKGNKIELRAYCTIAMQGRTADLDGYIITLDKEPSADANLELWVDEKKIDSCWDINFWRIIEAQKGFKKIWGLPIGMTDEQASTVEAFLNEVIESGKAETVIEHEAAKAAAEKAEKKAEAQKIIDTAAKYTTPIMTNAEHRVWVKRYNDVNNEGGEGYVPDRITVEQLEWAKKVIEKINKNMPADEEIQTNEIKKEIGNESAVYPPECKYNAPAEITVREDKVSVIFEKNDKFRETVKGLGYRWNGRWQKEINQTTGTAPERAAELGNKLLNAGFPISILDEDIRNNAINAIYEPECNKWVMARTKGDYEGWLVINWVGKDDTIYNKARSLPRSRWSSPSVVVKADYFQEVEEFARLYGFKITEKARELMEQARVIKEGAKVVAPVKAKEAEKVDGLKEILKSDNSVLSDLED